MVAQTITKKDFINGIKRLKTIEERLFYYKKYSKYEKNKQYDGSDCLVPYMINTNSSGYFYFRFEKKTYLLHRMILSVKLNINYKDIDKARHLCNNKRCIKSEHLAEGSASYNAMDSRESHGATKLNKEKVLIIKHDWKDNYMKYEYKKDFDIKWSKKLGVSITTICGIRLGRRWKDVIV